MKCESESDQRHYDRITQPEYPRTKAQYVWLESLRERKGKKFNPEAKPK